MSDQRLDRTVKELLDSGTFEPEELPQALAARGFSPSEVSAAVERAQERMRTEEESPARKQSRALMRRGTHLLRFGVLWLLVGLGFTIMNGAGLLSYVVVIGVGATLVLAGMRSLKSARVPRRDY
jgi:hypothetical protein